MKRRIVVEIDCEEQACGECIAMELNDTGGKAECLLFWKWLRQSEEGYLRCPACKRAEVKPKC